MRTPRSYALTLLFLVVLLNLLDRQVIFILAQDIKLELKLSDTELGLLTGTAFGLFKAIVSLPVAWYADRLDRPRMIAAMLAVWSACTMLCGMATGFAGLFIARVGLGIGESGGQPACTSLARDYFPQRPTAALALMMSGNPFGTFLAFLVGGAIAASWGWRWAFVAVGFPGLIVAVIILLTLREARPEGTPIRDDLGPALLAILRRPGFPLRLSAVAASMTIASLSTAWLPAFLIRTHGLTTWEMGAYGAVAIGLGGGIGTLSSLLCERARGTIRNPESAAMLVSLAMVMPTLLGVVFARSTAAALASFFLLNLVAFVWLAPTIRLIQDEVGPEQRALATAMCSATGFVVALVLAVPATGWVSDRLAEAAGPYSIGYALCLTMAVAVLLGLASHWAILRRLTRQIVLSPTASALS